MATTLARIGLCFVFVISVTSINLHSIETIESELDTYVDLITNIQHFYTAGSVYIVLDDTQEDLFANAVLFNLLRRFSSRKILSQAMRYSELFANYKSLYSNNKRQFIVLFITNEKTLRTFEEFTKTHSLSMHAWLVVFLTKRGTTLHDYCERPKKNLFHLNFDIRMLVKCLEDPAIREWYALDSEDEVRVEELMEWMPEKGLTQKTKRNFYQRRRDFHGKLLKVTTVKELTDVANTLEETDQEIEMIQRVMTEMVLYMNFNVSFRHSIPNYGLFNETERKWNGMLGNLSRGEIDMCFTDITMTQQRYQYFDWTWPIYMSPNVLFIKNVGKSVIKWNAYAKAFNYKIWISILFLMIIGSIVVTKIKTRVRNSYWKENHFLENQLYIWGIFCQQGLPEFPYFLPLRIAYISLFFSAIAIIAAYSGSIVGNLTNLPTVLPFTSFKEFVSFGTYKLIAKKNSYDHQFFIYNEDPIIVKMNKMMIRDKDLPANNVEAFQQICSKKVALYTHEATKDKVVGSISCKITAIPMKGNRFQALPLAKHNPLTNFVNYYIRRFEDYGLMKRTKNIYKKKDGYSRKKYDSVGIGEITPLLAIIILGVIISIFVLLLERVMCDVKSIYRKCVNNEITI